MMSDSDQAAVAASVDEADNTGLSELLKQQRQKELHLVVLLYLVLAVGHLGRE